MGRPTSKAPAAIIQAGLPRDADRPAPPVLLEEVEVEVEVVDAPEAVELPEADEPVPAENLS